MLIDEKVYTTWCALNRAHLESFGYEFTKYGDRVEVSSSELTDNSKVVVKVRCDNCGKVSEITYQNYLRAVNKNRNYFCSDCSHLRRLLDIEEVLKAFTALAYIPLFSEHKGAHQKLPYICTKHPTVIQYAKYSQLRTVGVGCFYCGIDKRSGENSPKWKGGVTSDNRKARTSRENRKWRYAVLERDNYTCRKCGRVETSKTSGLRVHHIYNFSTYKHLRTEVDNGISLCKECHSRRNGVGFHSIYGTVNNTKEQMEEFLGYKLEGLILDLEGP